MIVYPFFPLLILEHPLVVLQLKSTDLESIVLDAENQKRTTKGWHKLVCQT